MDYDKCPDLYERYMGELRSFARMKVALPTRSKAYPQIGAYDSTSHFDTLVCALGFAERALADLEGLDGLVTYIDRRNLQETEGEAIPFEVTDAITSGLARMYLETLADSLLGRNYGESRMNIEGNAVKLLMAAKVIDAYIKIQSVLPEPERERVVTQVEIPIVGEDGLSEDYERAETPVRAFDFRGKPVEGE